VIYFVRLSVQLTKTVVVLVFFFFSFFPLLRTPRGTTCEMADFMCRPHLDYVRTFESYRAVLIAEGENDILSRVGEENVRLFYV